MTDITPKMLEAGIDACDWPVPDIYGEFYPPDKVEAVRDIFNAMMAAKEAEEAL